VAVNNTVIYIPPGSYYFSDSILWPTDKRVFLICYGDLYFANNKSGFVIGSNKRQILWINGSIIGRNINTSAPDYTGLTSAAVWFKGASHHNTVYTKLISGFEDAFRLGGDAAGTATANGSQYNNVHWDFINGCKRGVHMNPRGGTTNQSGNYANESRFYGGRINAKIGVCYTKDANQETASIFNGDKFYNVGFEATAANPMDTAIKGDYAANQTFFSGRFEPTTITHKIGLTTSCDGFTFYGWIMNVGWLSNPGNSILVTGTLTSSGPSGAVVGYMATGYTYSNSGSTYNQMVLVRGTKRSPSVCGSSFTNQASELPSNINVVYDIETDDQTNVATSTIYKGINFYKVNYNGANTTALPSAASWSGQYLTIKSIHATGTVTVTGAAGGSTTSIPAYGAVTYYSDGVSWYEAYGKSVGGVGGTSQWTTSGSYIYYNNNIAVGSTSPHQYAWFQTGTGSTAKALMEFPTNSSYVSTPRNGSLDYNGTDLRFTSSSVSQKVLTDFNTATVLNKTWQSVPIDIDYWSSDGGSARQIARVNSAATALEFADPNYELLYANTTDIDIQNTTAATSMQSGVGLLTPVSAPSGSKYEFTATGAVYTAGSTQSFSIAFNTGAGSRSFSRTLPASLAGSPFKIHFMESFVPGSGYRYSFEMTVETNGTPYMLLGGSFASSSWAMSTNKSVTWSWGTASTSNRIRVFSGEWEVFRRQ
jgi:hypothetical protein